MSQGSPPADSLGPQLPSAFDDLRSAVALHDPNTGRIVDANERATELYGYPTAELQELKLNALSANTYGESRYGVVRRIRSAANGAPQTFEWRIKRKTGQLRWVEMTLTAHPQNGQQYVLAEVSDITDHKHNDRRISLLQRVFRHNLRNEISVIAGFADELTDPAATTPAATCADKISTAARTLSRVTESMKQIEATITSDAAARTRRSVGAAVRDVTAEVQAAYPAASINVTETTPLWVDINESFDHALRHAVENAVAHAGCEAPTVTVEIDASPNTGRVEIRIDDEGPPIPPVELDALDDHQETTPTRHGSGCGLFVMKWCLESLGGELRIEPANESGNSVYFYLPPKSPPDDAN